MQNYESSRHTWWECKYHVVFIPKCRSVEFAVTPVVWEGDYPKEECLDLP
jgi:hypothetical protein